MIDFRLQRMLRSYHKADPPPNRVKPVPVPVLHRVIAVAQASNDPLLEAAADMITMAFFFLLRPGEYADSSADSSPFRFEDVQLFLGQRRLDLRNATVAQLQSSTFSSLTFTDQKNGIRGEVIGLSPSGQILLCPTKAIARRIVHLRSHNAPPNAPLCRVYTTPHTFVTVKPSHITQTLRDAVRFLGPQLGFLPSDVSARCLRAAGANALLCAQVDTDVIRLIGRWRSDEMLRYLHCQAHPVMRDFSRRMLTGGNYTLIPNQFVPQY